MSARNHELNRWQTDQRRVKTREFAFLRPKSQDSQPPDAKAPRKDVSDSESQSSSTSDDLYARISTTILKKLMMRSRENEEPFGEQYDKIRDQIIEAEASIKNKSGDEFFEDAQDRQLVFDKKTPFVGSNSDGGLRSDTSYKEEESLRMRLDGDKAQSFSASEDNYARSTTQILRELKMRQDSDDEVFGAGKV